VWPCFGFDCNGSFSERSSLLASFFFPFLNQTLIFHFTTPEAWQAIDKAARNA
jgi:hypothetical protein